MSSAVAGQMTVFWSDPHQITPTGFGINYGPSDADFPAWSEDVGNTYITNGTHRSATITGLIGATEYKVRIRARYGTNWSRPWKAATITVAGTNTSANAAPSISSATSFTVAETSTAVATLTATNSDTQTSGLTWSIPSGANGGADAGKFSITAVGVLSFGAAKDFEIPDDADGNGAYQVTVQVSDGDDPDTADLTVTLSNVNEAPTANAGPDQDSVEEGATVTLSGSGTDPDAGEVLTYAWTQTAGAPTVTLSDAAVASPTFTAPTGSTGSSTFTFTLRVADDDGSFDEDSVDITVNALNTVTVETATGDLADGDMPCLTLTSNIATRIVVTWTAPTKKSGEYSVLTGYRVTWAMDGDTYPSPRASYRNAKPASTATSHTIEGLDGGVYKVKIQARYRQHARWWGGPWSEAKLQVEEPEVVAGTDGALQFALQTSSVELSAAAAALANDEIIWTDHLGTPYALASHDRVVLEWARLGGHDGVNWYKIRRKAPDAEAYTLPETLEKEGTPAEIVSLPVPAGALGSRFYHVDDSVSAETGYHYAVQAGIEMEGDGTTIEVTVPMKSVARTTKQPTGVTPKVAPTVPPVNGQGQIKIAVGPRLLVTPFDDDLSAELVVTLEAGEAYSLVLYHHHGHQDSHGHSHPTPEDTIVGQVTPYDAQRLLAPGAQDHSTYITMGGIKRASDSSVIRYRDSGLGYNESGGRFWNGALINSWRNPGTSAYVFHAPTAGDYVITVNAAHAFAQYGAQVNLIVEQPDVPKFGYGLGLVTRGSSKFGHQAAMLGNISEDDTDWFLVKLEAYKSYDVAIVTNLSWKGLTNPQRKFAGRNGVQTAGTSRLTISSEQGGYYHIGVSGTSSTDTGLYVLQITERDVGSTGVSALMVDVGRQVTGMIDQRNDRDWFGALLQCDQNYKIVATGSGGDSGGRDFAKTITLQEKARDSVGGRVASSTITRYIDSNNHLYLPSLQRISEIRFDPPCASGSAVYYFEVSRGTASGAGQSTGAYYFQISKQRSFRCYDGPPGHILYLMKRIGEIDFNLPCVCGAWREVPLRRAPGNGPKDASRGGDTSGGNHTTALPGKPGVHDDGIGNWIVSIQEDGRDAGHARRLLGLVHAGGRGLRLGGGLSRVLARSAGRGLPYRCWR